MPNCFASLARECGPQCKGDSGAGYAKGRAGSAGDFDRDDGDFDKGVPGGMRCGLILSVADGWKHPVHEADTKLAGVHPANWTQLNCDFYMPRSDRQEF